jgi:hypothetical protein
MPNAVPVVIIATGTIAHSVLGVKLAPTRLPKNTIRVAKELASAVLRLIIQTLVKSLLRMLLI